VGIRAAGRRPVEGRGLFGREKIKKIGFDPMRTRGPTDPVSRVRTEYAGEPNGVPGVEKAKFRRVKG